MLQSENVSAAYGSVVAIRDVSFEVHKGELVAIVGANGAGKSTILRTVSGLLKPLEGKMVFKEQRIDGVKPHLIVQMGLSHIPEGKQLFGKLSVDENLLLGAYTRHDKAEIQGELERVYGLFPRLAERRHQRAETLSGGEQQMLAIARGLMCRPNMLMIDEPSLGLMPKLVAGLFDLLQELRDKGMTILLVEQNVRKALQIADRAYVLQTGRIVHQGSGKELLDSDLVRRAYLGL